MPDSILGDSLVDGFVPLVDSMNQLAVDFGVRQHRVYLVHRQWSGGSRGAGVASISSEVEIAPRPVLEIISLEDSMATGCGREEEGLIRLSKVSLTFTEDELVGHDGTGFEADEDFFYRIADGHGQSIQTRYYTPAAPPQTDRVKTIGWSVVLRRTEVQE